MQIRVNLKKLPKFRLFYVTLKYEVEIVSNYKLLCYSELLVKFCTHCPSRSKNFLVWK